MQSELLPIRVFSKRHRVDDFRTEPGGPATEPSWLLSEKELNARAKRFATTLKEACSALYTGTAKMPVVLSSKIHEKATAKTWRGSINDVFRTRKSENVIGFSASEELLIKIENVSQAEQINEKLSRPLDYAKGLSALVSLSVYKPIVHGQDKTGLRAKIKLVDFQNEKLNASLQTSFEKLLEKRKLAYTKTFYTESMPVYSVEASQVGAVVDGLESERSTGLLYSIESMPRYGVVADELPVMASIVLPVPRADIKYETLGILDSGIADIPALEPWMSGPRQTKYRADQLNCSHGTAVATSALFGDALEGRDWIGHQGFKLLDVAVFPQDGVDEDTLVADIRKALRGNKKVKVWNLSLSIPTEISEDHFSDFAIALDDIQKETGSLICKSAGNCTNFLLSRRVGKLHCGADSILALTVGSVAHKKGKYDFAEQGDPSPFSRIGPGPQYIVKPEIAHYGGNAGKTDLGKLWKTGVYHLNAKGEIAESPGTSFSTPKIAALAVGLQSSLQDPFDELLIRALIIHSAKYPSAGSRSPEELVKAIGFGVPQDVRSILFNTPNEITLVLRDKLLKRDEIEILDFPMPKALVEAGFYSGIITATLVSDPVLLENQGPEYCQSNLELQIGTYDAKTKRDMTKWNVLNPIGKSGNKNILATSLYSSRRPKNREEFEALRERYQIQYGDKYYPVKKYIRDLATLRGANRERFAIGGKKWYLHLKSMYRDAAVTLAGSKGELPATPFCLIVTIKDPTGKCNVYNDVVAMLNQANFVNSSIKLRNDIRIYNRRDE